MYSSSNGVSWYIMQMRKKQKEKEDMPELGEKEREREGIEKKNRDV